MYFRSHRRATPKTAPAFAFCLPAPCLKETLKADISNSHRSFLVLVLVRGFLLHIGSGAPEGLATGARLSGWGIVVATDRLLAS